MLGAYKSLPNPWWIVKQGQSCAGPMQESKVSMYSWWCWLFHAQKMAFDSPTSYLPGLAVFLSHLVQYSLILIEPSMNISCDIHRRAEIQLLLIILTSWAVISLCIPWYSLKREVIFVKAENRSMNINIDFKKAAWCYTNLVRHT